jgi:hypothetical protein
MTGITYGELYFALDHLSQLHRKVIYLRFWNVKTDMIYSRMLIKREAH